MYQYKLRLVLFLLFCTFWFMLFSQVLLYYITGLGTTLGMTGGRGHMMIMVGGHLTMNTIINKNSEEEWKNTTDTMEDILPATNKVFIIVNLESSN